MVRAQQSLLYFEIENAILDGADTFYCGLTSGVDLWAADIVLHMQRQFPQVQLVAVLPYTGCLPAAQGTERYHLNSILENAAHIHTISSYYTRECFRERIRFMVTHSRRMIALTTDTRSGTGQAMRFAARAGLEMRVLAWENLISRNTPAIE